MRLVCVALLASLAQGQPLVVTCTNHTPLPVHATSVALDEAHVAARLGLPAGTPWQLVPAQGGAPLPARRDSEAGRPVVRVFLSLPPATQRVYHAQPAERWPDDTGLRVATPTMLRNGVVRFALTERGWSFGFDASQATLLTDGLLDFWVDDRHRGRLMNVSPDKLGLARCADAQPGPARATLGPDGQPTLTRTRRLGGVAAALSVTETFELVPGLPVLLCRVRWRNDGDQPLWIAYVNSGDGIRGRWSRELLPGPLIERKKSPLQGDLNGGETRCAWVGGLCRISMESPASGCGVGLSTLLPTPGKVGTGSMVWGCGASGFQCNFIDPEVGQFPFQVKPHGTLDNGFAFLAAQTGMSVHRQTVDLWTALQAGRLPRLAPPCEVFVGDEAVWPQTVGAYHDPDGRTRRVALRLEFGRRFALRVGVRAASAQEPLELVARPLAPAGKPLVLGRAEAPGELLIDLNQRFPKPDEASFVLEVKATGAAALGSLHLAEVLPVGPRLLSPVPGARCTDWAAMFRWQATPLVVDYQLQYARSADFAAPVEVALSTSADYPFHLVPDDKLPAPGTWYWRVRGRKGDLLGAWSETREFTVDAEHGKRPLVRPLSAARSLFTLEATRVLDYQTFAPDLPADVAPYVGIIAEGFEAQGIPVTDFARGMDKLPYAFLLRSHWVGLADIEWLFQHVPNMVGIQGGEHLGSLYQDNKDGDMRYHHRLTRLCAKYGRWYQEADGTYRDDKWQDLLDRQGAFVREFGPWLVLAQKNNIIRRQHYSASCALGLWLGGVTHHHGAWEDGGFYWQNAGFDGLGVCRGERSGVLRTMPRIFWTLNFVLGIGRGCGVYSLDGQTLMCGAQEVERGTAWPSAIWDNTGRTTDTFRRFVLPLLRASVQHQLIPTPDQVRAQVKLAVYNDAKGQGDLIAWPHYVEYGPLYAATYGFRRMGEIDGQLWEFFPNTGRYYFIPVLPQGNVPLGAGIRNVPVSQLQDVTAVRTTFEAAYPAWYEGDALACRVGDTLTVLNSNENVATVERCSAPWSGVASRLDATVGTHAYLVAKSEDGGRRLWLQTNGEYPDQPVAVTLRCARRPQWQIEPAAAALAADWDATASALRLRLSHRDGAVEVSVW